MNHKFKTISCGYYGTFRCIGSDCPSNCCKEWRIGIDRDTYVKYSQITDPEIKQLIQRHVTVNPEVKDGAGYAGISFEGTALCPFQTGDRLCIIQRKFGIEYLSKGCMAYPRSFNQINDTIEASVNVSCPVVAKALLLNPEKITFEEKVAEIDIRVPLSRRIELKAGNNIRYAEKHFYDIRSFAIRILQNRSLLFSERLIMLGMFCAKLKTLLAEMKSSQIPDAIDYYQRQLIDVTARDNIQKIPVHLGIQFELVRELVEKRMECGTQNSLYSECYEQFLKGFGYAKELSVDAMVIQYKKAYDAFYAPYMNTNEHIYEHYAVNYVFKNIFPFGKPDLRDVFDEYVMLVVNYAMIKLHLVGLAGYHEGLDDDTVINLIYSFTRTVEHSEKYLDLVFDFFSRAGFNTMGYMAIIIKS